MNRERWERIKDLHARALEVGEDERGGFLARECGGDGELLAQVRRLLESREDLRGFLEPPPKQEIEESLRLLSFDFRGCRLGEFELVERIGQGATGVVWRARQSSLGREVAIKLLAPHLCQSADKLERFEKEAFAASRLRHPNVVAILTVGEQEGVHYIAMEYVRGQSLQEILAKARETSQTPASPAGIPEPDIRDPRVAAGLVRKLAEALDHCHAQGVIHRDIKPQNVLIDPCGEPRVIDFGLARILEEEGITDTGVAMGTPHYMSPEQVLALGDQVDLRTDVYSLGALLYELLCGERPFEHAAPAEVPREIVRTVPKRLREVDPRIPRALAGICAKALKKNPDDRYSSAGKMALDLQRFLGGIAVAARRPSVIREGYHYVFHRKPWIAATALVSTFALFVIFAPRSTPVQAAAVVPESARQDSLSSLSEVERLQRQRHAEAMSRIHYLQSLLPKDPIYHDEEK